MAASGSGEGPGFVAPMLATPAKSLPPDTGSWVVEFKWDGMRCCVAVHRGRVRAWSRTGSDITARFPELAVLGTLTGPSLLLDGELVVLSDGRPDFGMLQRRMHTRPGAGLLAAVPVTLVAFDLLWVGSRTLTGNPYRQRRVLLGSLGLEGAGAIVSPVFGGEDAADVLAVSAERAYEGVVLKRPGSAYRPGRRSPDWVKVKIRRTIDVLIGGWLPGSGFRSQLAGSVIVGVSGPDGLRYMGEVGSGFPVAELRDLTAALVRLEQPASPFAQPLPAQVARHARWARPALAAEIAYAEMTAAGRLRHPVWRGLRAG
jgi:bifunctional non-homologous end joining protein LigD